MEIEQDRIEMRVERCVERFHDHDSGLLEESISEWSVAHKLGEYLQDEFPRFTVDCEYDGHLGDDKQDPRDDESGNVRPDIIIHRRGTDEHNLAILELKRNTGQIKKLLKIETRLRAFRIVMGMITKLDSK